MTLQIDKMTMSMTICTIRTMESYYLKDSWHALGIARRVDECHYEWISSHCSPASSMSFFRSSEETKHINADAAWLSAMLQTSNKRSFKSHQNSADPSWRCIAANHMLVWMWQS